MIKSRVEYFFSQHQGSCRKQPIANVADLITKGESPHWQGFGYVEKGIQFLTSENVLDGEISMEPAKYISDEFHKKLKRSMIFPGDVLINIVGASIGRACTVPNTVAQANTNQAVAIVRLQKEVIHQEFFLHHFRWPTFQQSFLGQQVNTARANISLTNIRETELLLPTIETQMELVNECEQIKSASRNVGGRLENVLHLKRHFLEQLGGSPFDVH